MRNTETFSLRWLELVAGLAGLIGFIGLIGLLTEGAWAAPPNTIPPKGGFERGPRTFSNPFAGAPPKGGENFELDDPAEEDEDFPDDFYRSPSAPPPPSASRGASTPQPPPSASSSAPSAPGSSPKDPTITNKGISMGGTTAGGVISHSKTKAIELDNDTGEGSREVVTDFNFPDADILDIAKALGKLTGKNFILDKDVKGRVTIISNSPITVSDAWKAFLTALDINGFALIPSGKYIRISRARDARDKQISAYTGDFHPDTDALITRVFPLKYLSAEEVARNFRSFMPANSRIIPYEQTNTVIVTDTGANITKLAKLLEILDVEGYDAGIEVITVKFASAVELSKLIDQLLPGTPTAGAGSGPRFGGGKFSSRRTKEGGIINTIIADERTNTLIVHANTKGADQIRELVNRLDQRLPASTGGGRVHVVYLQFAEAEQIANTLNNLSQASGARPPGPAGGTGVNPIQTSLFEGAIKVSPDKATNSLVITASPADFVTVQRVINKLDIPRDQVYAEVVIMEVGLGRDFNFSTNIINPSSGIAFTPNTDLFEFIQNPLSARGATIGIPIGGKTKVKVAGQEFEVANVQGLIRAIQTKSNSNVLATPQILALDNTEATFDATEKIPLPTITSVQGAGVTTGVTKENVSLSITIKPQINKIANFVKLDITTKLAEISNRELPAQVSQLAFATVERNSKTSIVVADRDTVVLGGLMRDNNSEQISKIPILGDIPLLGWLFRSKRTQSSKTNLLIFITPQIIRQYESIRAVLDRKLKERDDFLETTTGGEDPLRRYRDKMIRGLPDIKDITSYKPKKAVTIDSPDEEAPGASGDGASKPSGGTNRSSDSPSPPNAGPTDAAKGPDTVSVAPAAPPTADPARDAPPLPPPADPVTPSPGDSLPPPHPADPGAPPPMEPPRE